ncbi:MAG: phosphatase PAP2 family protein [Janthinobacterium lividum]
MTHPNRPVRMIHALALGFLVTGVLAIHPAKAQSASNMAVLRGLAPVTALPASVAGQAALAANLSITGAIQSGALKQPTLLPFPEQQQQALRDAFITGGNAAELADALGTKLGAVYQGLAHYEDARRFTSVSPAVAALLAYTNETTASDSGVAKYVFANETMDGTIPASAEAAAILARTGGAGDVFGRAYGHPAGSPGADAYGNSRPFQTEPSLTPIVGPDYFGVPSGNAAYLRGPDQDLTDSPSFPSGHTTYGTMEAVLLGILMPERYAQEITRAAEYGNDRILMGAHYAMDVIGGRALALYDVAHLLANDPAYVGQPRRRAPIITDYRAAVAAARAELQAALQSGCGDTIAACAMQDTSRFHNPAANAALYEATQTYGLPVVQQASSGVTDDVGRIAPEAGTLLTTAFPFLTLAQADDILTATEGPGGGFLDTGSAFGLYSRIDLYKAVQKAVAMRPSR